MDKNNGVYLMLQVHLFDASKVQFLERRPIKTEDSQEEQKQSIKLERPQTSVLHLIKKTKTVSRLVEQKIHFH